MTTPRLTETLVHLGNGGELEVRYYWDDYGVHVFQANVGHVWQDPTTIFHRHLIDAMEAEIVEWEKEGADA